MRKYKLTNISRTATSAGCLLDAGEGIGIIAPNSFAFVTEDKLKPAFINWQKKGYLKVELIEGSVVDEMSKMPEVHAKATELVIDENVDDDIDMEEPDIGMAVEASIPADGIVKTSENKKGDGTASAKLMGEDVKVVKEKELDALNPLLDEKAKEVDNHSKFAVKAPQQHGNERGKTIKS